MYRCFWSWFVLACVASALMAQQPTVPPKPKFDIMDWTPRPAVGYGEPWEKMTDPQWDDNRLQSMDTGPTYNGTLAYQHGRDRQLVYKGTAVRLGAKGQAGVIFDRATLRLCCGWTGSYLQHSNRRFALLNTPTPAPGHRMIFSTPTAAGWASDKADFQLAAAPTAPPVPEVWQYKGVYLHEDRVTFSYTVAGTPIFDTVKLVEENGQTGLVRTLQVGPHETKLSFQIDDKRVSVLEPSQETKMLYVTYGTVTKPEADTPSELVKPGAARWGKPLETELVPGDDSSPLAVDTLTIPYKNRFNALFFCTGVDVLPDGSVAVCTCHGDVWLVREEGKTLKWQRHATGLYHPLGLKVIDGQVVVLERGQLTRLHDNNNDGEADFYECISNAWHIGAGEHSYDTCLETDPEGNFYFFKTGDTELPNGGCLLRVSKDGSKTEIFATGFRHPIGLGMSPTGIVTGADQEGNYMPSTRIDQYKPGDFYGDLRAHHRKVPPTMYDQPICWLPREVDNSAGGQVWVPKDTFGPLAGLPLHFSYGRCRPFVLLRQELASGLVQGGVSALPIEFLSGSCRGRFDKQGRMLVCGLNGWQTAAKADGSLQRVRATGKPLHVVVGMKATDSGLSLTFSGKLDKASAENVANYQAAIWNYRWTADYGSKRWKVSNGQVEGQDALSVTSATLTSPNTVKLTFASGIVPAMQYQIGYKLQASDAKTNVTGSVFLTIHEAVKE